MRTLVPLLLALLLCAACCEELDGDLRLLLKNGPNERGGVDGDRTDLVSEKLSDAALATHEAILKATNKGRIGNAATLGFKMASAATNAATKHGGMHALDAAVSGRHLAAAANYRPDVGTMDTELASAAAITKAVNKPSMGSAKFATHVGISEGKVASGARKHGGFLTDLAAEEHPVRRMLSTQDRSGVGAMDTLNAASAAIDKAVKTPNMGGASYATTVGTKAGQVALRAHTGFDTDVATRVRRLAEHIPRRLMGL